MKSWKTTLGAALVLFGGGLGAIDPAWAKTGSLIVLFGTAFGLLFARDNNVTSEQAGATPKETKIRSILIVALAASLVGCARFKSTVTEETLADGSTRKVTLVKAGTLFDSKSDLARFSAGQTDKSQKIGIGGLGQESSGSNVVALVEGITRAAVSSMVKP